MAINSQIKARSITSKASSACKINMGLVNGENMMRNHSEYRDYAALTEKSFSAGGGDTTTASDEILTPKISTETPEEKAKRLAQEAEDKKKKKEQEIIIKN